MSLPFSSLQHRVRFVLVAPSHSGNIGAAARALKTMGFTQLVVVQPKDPQFQQDAQAVALATHAADVLAAARIEDSLTTALQGVTLAFAMTGYDRAFGPPLVDLRGATAQAQLELVQPAAQIAFVFGTERSGLTNEDVEQCHRCCAIPADGEFGSLNLAQAVQVAAYECRLALTEGKLEPAQRRFEIEAAASVEAVESFYMHLERALTAVEFLDPQAPGNLMSRLRRLFARARPSMSELAILRGICSALEQPKRERIGQKKGVAKLPD